MRARNIFRSSWPWMVMALVAVVVTVAQFNLVHATKNTSLDIFADKDINGSGLIDMTGPGGQGTVQFNQDDITGDLRVKARLKKSGRPNETYKVFVYCGERHAPGCGHLITGLLTTNGVGTGNSGEMHIAKCAAQTLMAGDVTGAPNQFHVDIKKGLGAFSTGLFVATPGIFDPSVGPTC